MQLLTGKVALVTGASRGVGKGVVLALAEAGATVYLTGRTLEAGQGVAGLPGTLSQTVREAERLGGCTIPVRVDHRDDTQTESLFERIRADHGRLDVVVNNVWGGYEHFSNGTEFWTEQGFWTVPLARWDSMFAAGVRAHYVCSVLAAVVMVEQRSGLIVTISSYAAGVDDAGVAYGAAKAADDHMVACMAHELRPHNVAAVALHPGLVRTEGVLRHANFFDLSTSESPQFTGRAVAALAADPDILTRSGQVLSVVELSNEYGFSDAP